MHIYPILKCFIVWCEMERIIFRVDDRFIHGQVIEGWINHFRIKNVILINDNIAEDAKKTFIYKSTMPRNAKLEVMSINSFLQLDILNEYKKGYLLIVVGSIHDLKLISSNIPLENSYINIGCLATVSRDITVTDNCFINKEELNCLVELSNNHSKDIYAHKLPWEKPINLKDIHNKQVNTIKMSK